MVSQTLLNRSTFGQQNKSTRIVLLGTKGGPRVGEAGRSNPATLLVINDVPYLIDCGYGVTKQLITAGIALDRLRYIFITHHHSDHNLEFGPLIYNTWITGLPAQIDAYGPPGLAKMAQQFFDYQKFDIDVRMVDEGRTDPSKLVTSCVIRRSRMRMLIVSTPRIVRWLFPVIRLTRPSSQSLQKARTCSCMR
jgi:ribonuclease BN (tRNA processing enzyme)